MGNFKCLGCWVLINRIDWNLEDIIFGYLHQYREWVQTISKKSNKDHPSLYRYIPNFIHKTYEWLTSMKIHYITLVGINW